ncbi:alpha-amylase family protein [Histomonas meleagridis]|uniref:alpha-amylase family protein n=1 Tax=Histomonas meleagridis TaxID=135588 RepID=UPI0035595754|nr:alpha-amylase family protein [Histomonas meleagridis]KAH0804383.1 alpha-amylase family protein [Histomonas meleagridis]
MLTAFLFTSALASTDNPRLLEVSTRPYLYLLTQKYGKSITKLRDIPTQEFDDMQSKGYEWVWFMGVWQLGDYGVQHDRTDEGLRQSYNSVLPGWTEEDVIGSPYCIVSYTCNSEIGTDEDLTWLRQQLNKRGMKLMLDYVPNHSAIDAPEVTTTPSFYIRCPQGETPDPNIYISNGIAYGCGEWCSPWTDVAQFNYMDTEFRNSRIQVLKKIASLSDGCRCDMAHLILNDKFWSYWQRQLEAYGYTKQSTEFWADAISAVKAEYPNFIFMAESYGDVLHTLHNCGFDYTYDKDLLDNLRDGNVWQFKQTVYNTDLSYKKRLAHFTENHDEPRSIANMGGNVERADAAAAALLTLPGLRFFFQNQNDGLTKKLDVHLRRAVSESPNSKVQYFYNKLYSILNMEALKTGDFTMQTITGSDTILTWKWVKGDSHVLVTVNFSPNQSGGYIICSDAPLSGSTIPVKEMINDVVYDRDPNEMRSNGLFVLLDGYQVQIFEY